MAVVGELLRIWYRHFRHTAGTLASVYETDIGVLVRTSKAKHVSINSVKYLNEISVILSRSIIINKSTIIRYTMNKRFIQHKEDEKVAS